MKDSIALLLRVWCCFLPAKCRDFWHSCFFILSASKNGGEAGVGQEGVGCGLCSGLSLLLVLVPVLAQHI